MTVTATVKGNDDTQADNAVADVFFFGIAPQIDGWAARIVPCCQYPDKEEFFASFRKRDVIKALGRAKFASGLFKNYFEDSASQPVLALDDKTVTVRVYFCTPKCDSDCKKCKHALAVFKTSELFHALGTSILLNW